MSLAENNKNIFEKFKKYRFEIRHVTLLFVILIVFQLTLSYIQKNSLGEFLTDTQKWYQKDAAERIANLTSTSLELLLENTSSNKTYTETEKNKIIQSFNIILSQQLLYQHVQNVCLIISKNGNEFIIDDGDKLYDYIINHNNDYSNTGTHGKA